MESEVQKNTAVRKNTVLVVDDEPDSLQHLCEILQPFYKLILLDSAEKVVEICQQNLPDIILLDIPLRGDEGFAVARVLKSEDPTRLIPIIFLTVKDDEEAIDKAFEAGGADYINKPFNAKELLVHVKTHLNLSMAKRRLRQAVDLVPHRIFVKDNQQNIILANLATAKFYSKKVEELLGQKEPPLPDGWVYEVMNNDKCPAIHYPDQMLTCEEQLLLPDGSKKYFLTNKIPFPFSESESPAVLEVVIDITEEKKRQVEINHLNEQLLKHGLFKDKLLSLIAHDLINSVFITNSTLTLLLQNKANISHEKLLEDVERVKNNSGKTLQLLVNLLEWSKAQFEAITYVPVKLQLEEEINHLQSILQPYLESKGMRMVCDLPAGQVIEADKDMLRTILRNLASNAIKYSNEGGTITVTGREKEGRVYITFADNGIGICPEHLLELQQGNLSHITTFGTKGEKGSGIGLNLSKEFIERLGGVLEIESECGVGSSFTFSVPAAPGKEVDANQGAGPNRK